MTIQDTAYRQLAEAQAIRIHGSITVRHPSAYPLQGLLLLRTAADRYGHLIGNRERVSFAVWADRIDADAVAGIDDDRSQVTTALRDMDRAAQPPEPPDEPLSLLGRIQKLARAVATPDTTIS